MATIKRFEDIEAWQKARILCKTIYSFCLRDSFKKDFRLVDQIKGSSGSIMDNIAEGFGRGGNKEFINFLSFSKGSSDETKSQLYRAFDFKYISENEFNETYKQCDEIINMISALMKYLRNTEIKGNKFKKDNQFIS